MMGCMVEVGGVTTEEKSKEDQKRTDEALRCNPKRRRTRSNSPRTIEALLCLRLQIGNIENVKTSQNQKSQQHCRVVFSDF